MKKTLLVASLLAAVISAHAQSPASGASPTPPSGSGAAQQGGPRGGAEQPRHGRQHGQMDAQKMVDHHITSLDTDKDGKVSRQEFLARQSEAFSKADENADGFVTREELAAQHQKQHAEMAASRDARRSARRGPADAAAAGGSSGSADSSSPSTSGTAK